MSADPTLDQDRRVVASWRLIADRPDGNPMVSFHRGVLVELVAAGERGLTTRERNEERGQNAKEPTP